MIVILGEYELSGLLSVMCDGKADQLPAPICIHTIVLPSVNHAWGMPCHASTTPNAMLCANFYKLGKYVYLDFSGSW